MTTETIAPKKAYATRSADAQGWYWGTGRRKTAVARVRVKAGNGEFMVNERPMDEFFVEDRDRKAIMNVLDKTAQKGKINVRVTRSGGGFTGQAGAVIMGLGRALLCYDANLESMLREHGFLTRDAREVERKKPGQAGARRRFQFSKR